MIKIILDTSFILTALKFKIDIFTELDRICDFSYRLSIIDKTLDELKDKKYSKLALNIIENKNVSLIKTTEKENVDNLILKIADDGYIVATQDRELKNKLKKKNIRIITIRQKRYLILI